MFSWQGAGQKYVEPFVGGRRVMGDVSRLTGGANPLFAGDLNRILITLYQNIQSGWNPPTAVSEEEYNRLKSRRREDCPLTGFALTCCSFGGVFAGGYARSGTYNYTRRDFSIDFAGKGARGIRKYRKLFDGDHIMFVPCSYESWTPRDCVVYCDPPYHGTTGYGGVSSIPPNFGPKWHNGQNPTLSL